MKKSIKITVSTISVILIILIIIVTVFARTNDINSLAEAKAYAESLFNSEKNAVINELADNSFNEILTEIKNIENSDEADKDKLAYYHIALSDKMSTASRNEITSAILDTTLSAESRASIIISAESNDITLDYERLSDAIDDDKYADIRPMLIDLVADATPNNIEEIEKIVENKSEGFSKAIRTLWEIKPTKAIAIADEIFADYSGEYDEIFRGAFSVKSYQAMLDPTDKNCAEYIALCDKILNTPCDNADGRETYMISWIEEIQSKEILIYCKEKGFADRIGTMYLELTLSKMLEEPASIENIELFLYYYRETPIANVWEAVNKHLANNEEFYKNNPELKNQLESIEKDNYELMSILLEPNEPREVK